MSKKNDLIDVSIRIGNSYDWEKITPGRTYNFRVYRNTMIKELQSICVNVLNHLFAKNLRNISYIQKI